MIQFDLFQTLAFVFLALNLVLVFLAFLMNIFYEE
jgi:hypothetical protein